jgi:hypothetical protein
LKPTPLNNYTMQTEDALMKKCQTYTIIPLLRPKPYGQTITNDLIRAEKERNFCHVISEMQCRQMSVICHFRCRFSISRLVLD